jgi:catechol 2,3-dioxygenase-like lactoylglutathione lyase family enzyme
MPTGAADPLRTTIVALDHVQLAMPAGGEDEARHFYADVLGLLEVPKPPALADRGGCWFTSPDRTVHVHLGVEHDFRPATKAHPAFLVHDLETARRRLTEAGADVSDDTSMPDVHRFYASDPFGNRIEFVDAGDGGFTVVGA